MTPLEFLIMRAQMRFRLAPDNAARLVADHGEQCAAEPLRRPCPFLLDGSCGIHAVRPPACRRSLMLDRPCAPGEICTESGPEAMLIPPRKALHGALALTFP